MASNAMFAEIAALAGDPARAGMLHALMDGRALSASELARVAGIAPQTATGHLARMTAAGLLRVEKQGRHHYHRLASPAVAQMMESIMRVASDLGATRPKLFVGPRDAAMRAARTCYDHLAGRLGVALADALVAGGHAEFASDGGPRAVRILCRPCLDWSERRPHLAGSLGAEICGQSFAQGWIRRIDGTRAVAITPKGYRIFREQFGAQLG
jgi:DNA-binding transcriptional ArsR family regulator